MKPLIRWSIRNTPAMNTMMASVLIVGALSLHLVHRELLPEFELEMILVTVPYPGASPEEAEEGICQKIEEGVQSIDGIKQISSVAREGSGMVVLELESNIPDVQKILNEVRSEIDRIPSFPELAEDPEVKQITMRREAIRIGVIGPDDGDHAGEVQLRKVAERVRDKIILLPAVKQADFVGAKEFQIDIEISEEALRRFGLTLQDVARMVRDENVELPGGTIKTDLQEVLLRGKDKRDIGHEIARLPLVTDPNGVVLTIGDLGQVRDEFADVTSLHRVDGRPAMVIKVEKTAREDLLAITNDVRAFIEEANSPAGTLLPEGYQLTYWSDSSVMVEDRLALLAKNGLQGLVLVFVALAIFLEIRLAFWVALGIPIAVLGACGLMLYTGQTLNMLSMFGFLMALGIVVDDAIVIGENIYAHRQMSKGFIAAAVDGTVEVLPSVLASVTTSIIAFIPLLFVPGVMGKFIAVIPLVVIAMLAISLLESTFILPCHLAHSGEHDVGSDGLRHGPVERAWIFADRFPGPVRWTFGMAAVGLVAIAWFFLYPFVRLSHYCNNLSDRFLNGLIGRIYVPSVRWSLRYPTIVIAAAASVLLIAAGLILGGVVPFNVFPKLDANTIVANIEYPDGTAASVTDASTRLIEDAIDRVHKEHAAAGGVVDSVHRMVGQKASAGDPREQAAGVSGSHVGGVSVELRPSEEREVQSMELVAQWRELVLAGWKDASSGRERRLAAGYESLTFSTESIGPTGAPIEFVLLAVPEQMHRLEEATLRCKAKLGEYPGVSDIVDDSRPGKWEFQLAVKDNAKAMGVRLADLAGTVRASYYGEEVMRLQRGRHEVKLMVRYPRRERRSLANFDEIRVRTGDGSERPLTELADVNVYRGYSAITRLDQLRAITVTADVEEAEANAEEIVADLKREFFPQLSADYPEILVRWEGLQEQKMESMGGLIKGLAIALICMFALLTFEFRSYFQPLLILAVIPFGTIGAIAGHWLLGLNISLMSVFGMVALTGVVVNDSIVLIDFMNRRFREGMPLVEAIVDAGRRRFRPVMLTTATTVAALLPILLEQSLQAQVVIPMATSLAFGLLFATFLVLVLVPTLYLLYCRYFTPAGDGMFHESESPPLAAEVSQPVETESPVSLPTGYAAEPPAKDLHGV